MSAGLGGFLLGLPVGALLLAVVLEILHGRVPTLDDEERKP